MSRHPSIEKAVTIDDTTVVLEIIREEQTLAATPSNIIDPSCKVGPLTENKNETCPHKTWTDCPCVKPKEQRKAEEIDKILKEKENQLRAEFQVQIEKEVNSLKEKFDYILQNEQIRTNYMLREAHRERQEKIKALQTQLECKNLAGLMYVMCSETKRSKLEKLRLNEEYTTYIRALQCILSESQALILNLSRGYKTAARVDHEWREKMKIVLKEFQMFVHDFAKGTSASDQFFFDVPALLKTEAPIYDNPDEDPCEKMEEEEELDQEREKHWWEMTEGDCRPFIMFGDMADFKPQGRRQVLKAVKAAKTAPPQWKEYVFNEMFLKSDCANADVIKDEYPKRLYMTKTECHGVQTVDIQNSSVELEERHRNTEQYGTMGSIFKLIATSAINQVQQDTNTAILGARDSMEITSATKLRSKIKDKRTESDVSVFPENKQISIHGDVCYRIQKGDGNLKDGSQAADELQAHEQDHKINYEKVCPMDECKRMQVDSFMRSLPSYMQANPFTRFEYTYDEYETCSPEQLEILKKRIEDKRKSDVVEEPPTAEWEVGCGGIGVQTSELSLSLPPCTCIVPNPSTISSLGVVYNIRDLIPVKEALDTIYKECFFDNTIQFDRFLVIGEESQQDVRTQEEMKNNSRFYEIKKILNKHPSLCEIFQGNTRC